MPPEPPKRPDRRRRYRCYREHLVRRQKTHWLVRLVLPQEERASWRWIEAWIGLERTEKTTAHVHNYIRRFRAFEAVVHTEFYIGSNLQISLVYGVAVPCYPRE